MKKYFKIGLNSALAAIILSTPFFSSCMDYDDINAPKYLPSEINLYSLHESMQNIAYPVQENNYQMCENLIGDVYGRYMGITNDGWETNYGTFNAQDSWLNFPFDRVFSGVYSNLFDIQKRTEGAGVAYAWAQLLRVTAMHRMTDLWGPIPYSKVEFGKMQVPYDTQEEVYKHMFEDLDYAIKTLTTYAQTYPDDRSTALFDMVYGGDFSKWVKFGNSLKLRMAMRIVYADPVLAKEKAEEAVSHQIGVITSNEDNASILYRPNPIKIMWLDYTDTRVCADLVTYMQGYKDPRMPKYFQKGKISNVEGYYGIRVGINIPSKAWALEYSAPNVHDTDDDRILWMNAAEVAFLKSEGAMRGWSMGGTAEDFYATGVKLSFAQYGASGYDDYIKDNTSKQANYDDPTNPIAAQSTITIKWDESATNEVKLEKIITQKWIAMWPLGQEAWSEHRRTGYPRFFPVPNVKNPDTSLRTKFAARIPYPPSEKLSNTSNYNDAVTKLGGADNYSTKMWWDNNPAKP